MQELQQDSTQRPLTAGNSATAAPDPAARASADECLSYLAEMTGQLGRLASQAGYERLAVILELACDEAHLLSEKHATGAPGSINPEP